MNKDKCKTCDNGYLSGGYEVELCTVCQIGSGSPSLWLLNKIYQDLIKQFPVERQFQTRKSVYSSLTYNAKTGECVGICVPSDQDRRDFVTIAVSVECDYPDLTNIRMIFYRWLDGGTKALGSAGPHKISNIDNFVAEASQFYVLAISELINFLREDMYYCVGCSTEKKNPSYGKYFAGTYCKSCWEFFKKRNSRICLKCKQPQWSCYC